MGRLSGITLEIRNLHDRKNRKIYELYIYTASDNPSKGKKIFFRKKKHVKGAQSGN